MHVNQKIENALSPALNGRVWPVSCPLEEDPDKWVVYSPVRDTPPLFGDNRADVWVHQMEIHYCARGVYDYISDRKAIRDALTEAGFILTGIEYSYEYGTTYRQVKATHIVFSCWIEEDEDVM